MIHSWVRREVGECPADAAPSTAQEQGASIVSAAYTHFESVGRRDEADGAPHAGETTRQLFSQIMGDDIGVSSKYDMSNETKSNRHGQECAGKCGKGAQSGCAIV